MNNNKYTKQNIFCRYLLKGICKFGDKCNFVHSSDPNIINIIRTLTEENENIKNENFLLNQKISSFMDQNSKVRQRSPLAGLTWDPVKSADFPDPRSPLVGLTQDDSIAQPNQLRAPHIDSPSEVIEKKTVNSKFIENKQKSYDFCQYKINDKIKCNRCSVNVTLAHSGQIKKALLGKLLCGRCWSDHFNMYIPVHGNMIGCSLCNKPVMIDDANEMDASIFTILCETCLHCPLDQFCEELNAKVKKSHGYHSQNV
jgi:hypothetical protein